MGNENILHRFFEWNAPRHENGVGTLCEQPPRVRLDAGFMQKDGERHAGLFATARETVRFLHRDGSTLTEAKPVARTLDEVYA